MEILIAALRRQERRLRLEQILLLAARCLLFGLAGLALARPTLEQLGFATSGRRLVTIVLDDGASSWTRADANDPNTSGFERLRAEATALVRGLQPGDAVGVVLASHPARTLVAPATTDREAVARAIESIEPSAAATDLAAAMSLANTVSGQTGSDTRDAQRTIAVLSEFRLGSVDPSSPKPTALSDGQSTSQAAAKLLARAPANDDVSNIAITSIEPQRSVDDDSVTVVVQLNRSGGANPPQTVRVSLDGDAIGAVAAKQVRMEAGQATARVDFVVRALVDGARNVTGRLSAHLDEDRMPLDDARFASFDARGATRVGIVARRSFGAGAELDQVPASRWLARAIEPVAQPGLEVTEIEPASVDARSLRDIDALFIPRPETLGLDAWTTLSDFINRGGLAVFMPSAEIEAQRWTERFTTEFALPWQIAVDAPVLTEPLTFAAEQPQSGIFNAVEAELPDLLRPIIVSRRVEIRGASAADIALALSDGSPFLLVGSPLGTHGAGRGTGLGLVVLVASAPELSWTNLSVKPFMVPFAQEIVRRGLVRIGRADRVVVGDRLTAPRDAVELVSPTGTHIGIDAATNTTASPLTVPGVWTVVDATGRAVSGVAANIDPLAARPSPQSREVIATWLGGAATPTFIETGKFVSQLNSGERGTGIAFWVLAAVAIVAILESLMARMFSHAAIVRGSSSDPGVGSSALLAGSTARQGAAV